MGMGVRNMGKNPARQVSGGVWVNDLKVMDIKKTERLGRSDFFFL